MLFTIEFNQQNIELLLLKPQTKKSPTQMSSMNYSGFRLLISSAVLFLTSCMSRNSCFGVSFEVMSRVIKILSFMRFNFRISFNRELHQVFFGGIHFLLIFFLHLSFLKLYHSWASAEFSMQSIFGVFWV